MSHEGTQRYDEASGPWQRRNPTWRGMSVRGLDRVEPIWWTDQVAMVESSEEPFMAPFGHVTCEALGGGKMEERILHQVCLS